jgi:hypothetical protein
VWRHHLKVEQPKALSFLDKFQMAESQSADCLLFLSKLAPALCGTNSDCFASFSTSCCNKTLELAEINHSLSVTVNCNESLEITEIKYFTHFNPNFGGVGIPVDIGSFKNLKKLYLIFNKANLVVRLE